MEAGVSFRDMLSGEEAAAAAPAATGAAALALRLITDPAELLALWRALYPRAVSTVFSHPQWLGELLPLAAARGAQVLGVTVCLRGRVQMLLPFVATKAGGVRLIEALDFELCDYAAPLCAADFRPDAEAMRAIWREALRLLPKADLLVIRKIRPDLSDRPNPYALLPGVRRSATEAFGLSVAPPTDTLLERTMRSSTFRDYRKFRRRLERKGEVAFRRADTPELVESIFAALLDQRRSRFRAMGRLDLMEREDVASFYRRAAHNSLHGGPTRLFALTLDGVPVATSYGLADDEAMHLVIQTMAGGELKNCSPGVLVTAETVEWTVREGLTYFDFTIGHLPYKEEFGAGRSDLMELVLPLSLKGRAVLAAKDAGEAARAWLKARPALYRTLRDLRRAMRRRGAAGETS